MRRSTLRELRELLAEMEGQRDVALDRAHEADLIFKAVQRENLSLLSQNRELEKRAKLLAVPVRSHDATVAELTELILYLSLTYNGNDPAFEFGDWYGHILRGNIALFRTWMNVVRGWSREQIEDHLRQVLGDEYLEDETPGRVPGATKEG
jgi:hypothetical protein